MSLVVCLLCFSMFLNYCYQLLTNLNEDYIMQLVQERGRLFLYVHCIPTLCVHCAMYIVCTLHAYYMYAHCTYVPCIYICMHIICTCMYIVVSTLYVHLYICTCRYVHCCMYIIHMYIRCTLCVHYMYRVV